MKHLAEIVAYNAVYEHNVLARMDIEQNSSLSRFHKAMARSMHLASLEPEFSNRKQLTENKKLYYAVCVGLAGDYLADTVTYFRYDDIDGLNGYIQNGIEDFEGLYDKVIVVDYRRGNLDGVIAINFDGNENVIDVQLLEGDMPENED